MKKITHWFIGAYLSETDNVFVKAKVELLFRILLFYILDHIVFLGNLIPNHYYYHLVLVGSAATTYVVLLYMMRKHVGFPVIAKILFYSHMIIGILSYLVQESHMDLIGEFWMIVSILVTFFTLGKSYGFVMSGVWFAQIVYCSINDISGGKLIIFRTPPDQILPPAPPFVLIPYVLSIYIIYEFVRTRSLAERDINEQKKLIQEKNTEITDSITYAKRIQQAKLPEKREIAAALPESFVLFKPKDIVSGDFYYFSKKEAHLFIAAADCTGHGVPGAFMSIVGSEKLNDAVMQSNEPDKILMLLNMGIKTSLKQTDSAESTRDGMDIALCVIDKNRNAINYSGANRPLWLIRKNAREVEEIKATKKAIGGFTQDDQLFEKHEIQLERGDTFYLFSDGYTDMFGGAEGKKLTSKRFKQVLLEIQNKTMAEQEKYLEEFAASWLQSIDQIDDILVIGLRI